MLAGLRSTFFPPKWHDIALPCRRLALRLAASCRMLCRLLDLLASKMGVPVCSGNTLVPNHLHLHKHRSVIVSVGICRKIMSDKMQTSILVGNHTGTFHHPVKRGPQYVHT